MAGEIIGPVSPYEWEASRRRLELLQEIMPVEFGKTIGAMSDNIIAQLHPNGNVIGGYIDHIVEHQNPRLGFEDEKRKRKVRVKVPIEVHEFNWYANPHNIGPVKAATGVFLDDHIHGNMAGALLVDVQFEPGIWIGAVEGRELGNALKTALDKDMQITHDNTGPLKNRGVNNILRKIGALDKPLFSFNPYNIDVSQIYLNDFLAAYAELYFPKIK